MAANSAEATTAPLTTKTIAETVAKAGSAEVKAGTAAAPEMAKPTMHSAAM